MTLKQLLSPAVISHCAKNAERNKGLSREERIYEFNKWFIENEDLINESVKNNIDKINECIERSIAKSKLLREANFNDLLDDDDDNKSEQSEQETQNTNSSISGVLKKIASDDDDSKKVSILNIINNVTSDSENDENNRTPKTINGDEQEDKNKDGDKDDTFSIETVYLYNNPESPNDVFNAINSAYESIIAIDKIEGTEFQFQEATEYWSAYDVSEVTDMTALFAFTDLPNADLGSWDVKKVLSMEGMFYKSTFNSPSIKKWYPSSCDNFDRMFQNGNFSHDLTSSWENRTKEIEVPEFDNTGKFIGNKTINKPVPTINGDIDDNKSRIKKHWSETNMKNLTKMANRLKVKSNNKTNESKEMKHILDFETFINEGFIKDTIKKGFDKVKSFFKNLVLKLNDIIVFFDKDGKILEATSPYTSYNLISKGKVKGVKAFSKVKNDLINDDVKSVATIEDSQEFYDYIGKDSIEYRNIQTLVHAINENYGEYDDINILNERNYDNPENRRVGFSAKEGGLKEVIDINSKTLKLFLRTALNRTPGYVGDRRESAMLIWGAPGVGKSTIPKAIIEEWNSKHGHKGKKGLIVVECGDLTIDGFSVPMPSAKQSLGDLLKRNPEVFSRMKERGTNYEDPVFQEYLQQEVKGCFDAIKDWLPFYKESNNPDVNRELNAVANGAKNLKYNKNIQLETENTSEGGIILFDEFFRANENIFKILMQILLNRKFSGGYVLGDKWTIVACSNRPLDDTEVGTQFDTTGAVVGTRFGGGQFNFVPDFKDWAQWAYNYGGFDYATLSFLMKDVNENGEYTNWHTINPAEYKDGRTIWNVPRSWTEAMNGINLTLEEFGFSSIIEVLNSDDDDERTEDAKELIIKKALNGNIGPTLTQKYIDYIKSYDSGAIFKVSDIFTPGYTIPKGCPAPENVKEEENVKAEEVIVPKITPTEIAVKTAKYIAINVKNDITDENLEIMCDNIKNNFKRFTSIVRSLFPFILDKLGLTKYIIGFLKFKNKYDKLVKDGASKDEQNDALKKMEEYINSIKYFVNEQYPKFTKSIIDMFNLEGENEDKTIAKLIDYQKNQWETHSDTSWRSFI